MLRMANVRTDDTRNLLSYIQLFEGMTPNQLDWVAQHAHRRNFEAGRNVRTIEQPGEAVYIILHGTVRRRFIRLQVERLRRRLSHARWSGGQTIFTRMPNLPLSNDRSLIHGSLNSYRIDQLAHD